MTVPTLNNRPYVKKRFISSIDKSLIYYRFFEYQIQAFQYTQVQNSKKQAAVKMLYRSLF